MASKKNEKIKKRSDLPLHIATPFVLLALSAGIIKAASIKPYDKIKVYKNLAFMDELKKDPDSLASGLVIKENEIVEEFTGTTSDTGEVKYPVFGEMYAVLKSSAFDLSVPVYWGCNIEIFEKGAGQSTNSSLVGTDGNVVISAHEDTFFAELKNMKVGDTVSINTNYGVFSYEVKELIQFEKSDTRYVRPSKENKLTLYTCKKDIIGGTDERIGVICEMTGKKFYIDAKEGE